MKFTQTNCEYYIAYFNICMPGSGMLLIIVMLFNEILEYIQVVD